VIDGPCPRCHTDHLHVDVVLSADSAADHFQARGSRDAVRITEQAGVPALPREVILTCCACDWEESVTFEVVLPDRHGTVP
jgi:hypothetical protein